MLFRSFVFAAQRHHALLHQPLQGWFGHANPFAFVDSYEPAPGMQRMLAGTSSQLSLIALEAALTAFDGVDLQAVRRKSEALTDLFIRLADQELTGFGLASPRETAQRGSQVALTHPDGHAIMQALIARGVIGDYRAPNILRFGFTPLYLGFADVWHAIAQIKDVMHTQAWQAAEFNHRKAVT